MKKFIGKILAAALSLTTALSALTFPTAAETQFETAQQAVDNIRVGWNLGNALDSNGEWIEQWTEGKTSDYETAWGNPVTTKELITAVKAAGFNAVRIPVTWYQHIDSKGNIDSDWLKRVNEVVDYVISQDMYCVVNVHHDAGSAGWLEASTESYSANAEKFAGLWKNIAERFKDYGEKLIFEAYNEILDANDSWTETNVSSAYDAANEFNQLFVDTVRSTGGNNAERNLMVETYSASCSAKTLNGFVLPNDSAKNHLIVQVHNYDPMTFTHSDEAVTWTETTDTWGTNAEKSYLDSVMTSLESFSKKIGAPVVVGEFGAAFKDNDTVRAEYAEYFVGSAYNHGIKCFWWDTQDFGLFDRDLAICTHKKVVTAMMNVVPEPETDNGNNAADNDITENTITIPTELANKIGGTITAVVEVSSDESNKSMTFDVGSGSTGKFATLLKYDSSAEKAEYIAVTKIDGSSVVLNAADAGIYFLVVDNETKLVGDLNNDGIVNAMDAAQILKNIVSSVAGTYKSDFNGDGNTNALDASDILKFVIAA